MDDNSLKVIQTKSQYSIRQIGTHSVVLDILAEDSTGQIYEIEMQTGDKPGHIRRVRYITSSIDTSFLDKGNDYTKLPELHIFYITTFDIANAHKTVYDIIRIDSETHIEFDNGVHEHYINTIVNDGSTISNLMHYFNMILGVILALILNELRYPRFKKVSQTILYLPHFLSWAIIGSVAMTMFRPNSGLVNILLTNLGVISEGIPFLNEKWHWAITYLLIGVWQTMGWGTILYLAAITGINGELYEAAMIDGANRWKRMWHITLPGIKSTVVTLLILNLGRVMGSNLERLTALENSQVKDFQYQLAVYIYNKGIGAGKFSAATAVGLFQSLIGLILVLLSDKFAKKLGEDGLL